MSGTAETPKLPATELFLWQLCKTYAQEFPDPLRPVRSELVAAIIPRVVRLLVLRYLASDLLADIKYAVDIFPESSDVLVAKAADILHTHKRELVSQIGELDSWLHEPGVDEMECGNWLTANGYLFQEASELLTRAKRHQAGRRPTKRQNTVAAVEARRLDASYSWSKLAKDFCDCEKPRHDDLCAEALRKSASQLESVLRKYRKLPVPAALIAPLANEFLDRLG